MFFFFMIDLYPLNVKDSCLQVITSLSIKVWKITILGREFSPFVWRMVKILCYSDDSI